jgi:hypothetical protein
MHSCYFCSFLFCFILFSRSYQDLPIGFVSWLLLLIHHLWLPTYCGWVFKLFMSCCWRYFLFTSKSFFCFHLLCILLLRRPYKLLFMTVHLQLLKEVLLSFVIVSNSINGKFLKFCFLGRFLVLSKMIPTFGIDVLSAFTIFLAYSLYGSSVYNLLNLLWEFELDIFLFLYEPVILTYLAYGLVVNTYCVFT